MSGIDAIQNSGVQAPCPAVSKISAIRQVVRNIFEVLGFPFRFVGGKNWSIPGVVLRVPWIVFKKVILKETRSFKELLFPNFYKNDFEKSLTKEELKDYYPQVCTTAFVCSNSKEYIPQGWHAIDPQELQLEATRVPEAIIEGLSVVYPSSTLRSSFIENADKTEIILAFSSLEPNYRRSGRFPTLSKGWNIALSIAGFLPNAAKQADSFVTYIKDHPYFKGKKLTLSGNSYGATLAQYAGLKNAVSAVCYNSFALGVGWQHAIGRQRLEEADKYVTHISGEGDCVTDWKIYKYIDPVLNGLGCKTLGNFGRRFKIPSAYTKMWDIHGYILGSVSQYLGYGVRAYPANVKL
ncbi:MAG: hypothetical protein FJZ63_04225 [Chlamydiae bacterium]|nr:hypothetical protein [Chlamydiota bacterium]